MSEERNRITWEPWAACVCFVVAGISLVMGFVFTTRWLLDDHIHPLLHGIGLVLLIAGIPILILGGHFMDLNEKKAKRLGLIIIIFFLWLNPGGVNAQNADAEETTSQEKETSDSKWQYGGFVDLAYPLDFNHPENRLFRSRGTAFRTDSVWLNMAGAYARKKPSEDSPWGFELTAQTGKDDEFFGFSATAPNIAGHKFLRHLGPTNVSYLAPAGKGVTIQSGIFSSLIGYDSLYAKDNLNYTRPWGADFTPYLMMGVNAAYPFTEKMSATFFVVNGYWHLAQANHVPSSGVQLAYKPSAELTIKQTVFGGPHQSNTALPFWRYLSDTIVERRTKRVVAAAEIHFSTEVIDSPARARAWWVAAQLPIRWNVHGPWSLGVRPEFAWDSDGRWTLA